MAVEIHRMVEASAPNAFPADMLDQGRSMIEHRLAQSRRQARDLDVLFARYLVPATEDMLRGRPGE